MRWWRCSRPSRGTRARRWFSICSKNWTRRWIGPNLRATRPRCSNWRRTAQALSGFLVTWAQNNPDEKIKALTPRYKIFDASTQQVAAELTTDPAKRKDLLEAALKRYQSLEDPNNPDAMVEFGLGSVEYDLGDYQAAKSVLGSLVVNKRVGAPTVTIQENGQPKTIENTQYWQANFELLRSVAEFARANPSDAQAGSDLEAAKTYLKQLYIQWPKTIGGQKFHGDFENLRAEMIPDFHPATD